MGPDLEKSKVTNGFLANKDQEDKQLLQCINNYEDDNFNEEALNKVPARNKDMEIDIIGCTKSGDNGEVEARYEEEDVTESMSSFGDSLSENENGSPLLGELEVDSRLCEGVFPASSTVFDGCGGGAFQMRRKKLTDHWRRFIRPLMWRCKWIELQIKEFQSQALKYDRELAEHAQRKQFDFDSFVVEGFDTKSLPFSSCIQRKKVMKRKKRKRVEEMTDVTSYMLQHNLFSYYENRKSAANVAPMNDDYDNLGKAISANDEFGFHDGWTSFETKDEDNIQENILWKIEVLQLQVRKLKARIEKVVSENPGKFSSVNRLSMPASGDAMTGSDHNPVSAPEDGDRMCPRSLYTLSQHACDFNMGDLMPDSVVSSHGEVTPLPDMIEGTGQPLGVSDVNTEEENLMHNQAAKEEMQDFKNIASQQAEVAMEKQTVRVSQIENPTDTFVPRVNFGGKTLPKSRSNISNNKRKRGRRKSRRGGWNHKS
ncbi:uncharacterized protein LOC8285623 [Ricinus communis]|uniref:uncharacterized protein LOC8285623 n=1 Tax=Ricinus communis TaxID=3988 RepID=UPI00201B1999|nr:uncharacterized protein LOC8285623 [Ricinus communis]XP_048232766.1 uncharacterized protein LOC8285623 [Ricinus communis]XP_048232767.1 uncharacterized protein LOC8285623 [Ricinus communis]